ncbi:spore cortex biosynthesis protein YabQ [Bacillus sp. 03113]|uniref:spore cortex biosynthesis protein YabQ n=1 Tax=Bacillus sp. 03113 TaxID=2578211 RepID=UPI001142B39C|nr:spore cortex biosynthesis protein YabQ [Bacillus sp. 03113]
MTLSTQFMTMLAMVGMGTFYGASLDTYQRFLKRAKRKSWLVFINDLLFWALHGLLVFYVLFIVNRGELRFYLFLAILCGFAAYQGLFKRAYLWLLECFISICISIYLFIKKVIILLIYRPIFWIISTIIFIIYKVSIGILKLIFLVLKAVYVLFRTILLLPLKWILSFFYNALPKSIKKIVEKFYNKIAGHLRSIKKFALRWILKRKK